jgi:ABC-type Fe3+-hydroxamate transport system substrate-binding protein
MGVAMFKYKVTAFILSMVVLMVSAAYCQVKAENRNIQTTIGTVTMVDAVGNIIEINTADRQIAFSVPEDTKITLGTVKIGLMDIEVSDPVEIQYYSSSPGEYTAVSIVDNNIEKM